MPRDKSSRLWRSGKLSFLPYRKSLTALKDKPEMTHVLFFPTKLLYLVSNLVELLDQ